MTKKKKNGKNVSETMQVALDLLRKSIVEAFSVPKSFMGAGGVSLNGLERLMPNRLSEVSEPDFHAPLIPDTKHKSTPAVDINIEVSDTTREALEKAQEVMSHMGITAEEASKSMQGLAQAGYSINTTERYTHEVVQELHKKLIEGGMIPEDTIFIVNPNGELSIIRTGNTNKPKQSKTRPLIFDEEE